MGSRGITALERSVAKQFATRGLNQVLGCTNLPRSEREERKREHILSDYQFQIRHHKKLTEKRTLGVVYVN
jgi:hypothetical protein